MEVSGMRLIDAATIRGTEPFYPNPQNSENPEIRLFLKIAAFASAGAGVVQYRYCIPALVF